MIWKVGNKGKPHKISINMDQLDNGMKAPAALVLCWLRRVVDLEPHSDGLGLTVDREIRQPGSK
jgi:hypothetical protein